MPYFIIRGSTSLNLLLGGGYGYEVPVGLGVGVGGVGVSVRVLVARGVGVGSSPHLVSEYTQIDDTASLRSEPSSKRPPQNSKSEAEKHLVDPDSPCSLYARTDQPGLSRIEEA